MRRAWLVLALVLSPACSDTASDSAVSGDSARPHDDTGTPDTGDSAAADSADTAPAGACAELAGSAWGSVEELECGLGPDGVALCHWRLSFTTDGAFMWRYSDVGEGGRWACVGEALTATTDGGRVLAATLVDASHLDWERVAYLRDGAR